MEMVVGDILKELLLRNVETEVFSESQILHNVIRKNTDAT